MLATDDLLKFAKAKHNKKLKSMQLVFFAVKYPSAVNNIIIGNIKRKPNFIGYIFINAYFFFYHPRYTKSITNSDRPVILNFKILLNTFQKNDSYATL